MPTTPSYFSSKQSNQRQSQHGQNTTDSLTTTKEAPSDLTGWLSPEKPLWKLKQLIQQKEKRHFHKQRQLAKLITTEDEDKDAFDKYWEELEVKRKRWHSEKGIDKGTNGAGLEDKETWIEWHEVLKGKRKENGKGKGKAVSD